MYHKKKIVFLLFSFSILNIFSLLNASMDFIENRGKTISNLYYEDYGEFKNLDSNNFVYDIKRMKDLKLDVGDFVYPNINDRDKYKKLYDKYLKAGEIRSDIWENFNSGNPEADILAWLYKRNIDGNEKMFSDGIRQYFIAEILRNNGEYDLALKAYYAVILHFSKAACWNSEGTFVWYLAPAALEKINLILRENPNMNLKLENAYVYVVNGNDTDFSNDKITINPGRFVKINHRNHEKHLLVSHSKKYGNIDIVKYNNGDWSIFIDGEKTLVKGITYSPVKVGGKSSAQNDWMFLDSNNNGILDVNEVWVDKNSNNELDFEEEKISDFKLLQEMGINAIRMYHMKNSSVYDSTEYNKSLMREIYNKYKIRFILGDFLGSYGIGSGGKYTDYKDQNQRRMMKENVKQMVLDHKDEPYVLMWIIGNENDMPDTSGGVNYTNTNARECPDDYASFLAEVIDMIHAIDKNHPVILANMTLDFIENYKKAKVDMDIFGINLYMGKDGFGVIWDNIKRILNIPMLITEYGCDAYFTGVGEDEKGQEIYHLGCWKDIYFNSCFGNGTGNSIGGVIFEWLDEWWKSGQDPKIHVTSSQSQLPFPDNAANEEWFGIVGQGNGKHSPFQRNLRKAYFMYKNLLNNKIYKE